MALRTRGGAQGPGGGAQGPGGWRDRPCEAAVQLSTTGIALPLGVSRRHMGEAPRPSGQPRIPGFSDTHAGHSLGDGHTFVRDAQGPRV